ncbi:unnamed protein product [Closterium sp. NIES-64]|nr:unnamed protein product [Closterium sp. NIES-64]
MGSAFLLVDEQCAEQASYRELVVLRHATERLLRVVDTSMHSVIQRERHASRRELAAAQRARRQAEVRQQQCGRLERELGEERSQHAAVAALLVGASRAASGRCCGTRAALLSSCFFVPAISDVSLSLVFSLCPCSFL